MHSDRVSLRWRRRLPVIPVFCRYTIWAGNPAVVVGISLGESNVLAVIVSLAFIRNDTIHAWSAYRSMGLAPGISRRSDLNGGVKTCGLVEPDTAHSQIYRPLCLDGLELHNNTKQTGHHLNRR
jgi:hypothetical protein